MVACNNPSKPVPSTNSAAPSPVAPIESSASTSEGKITKEQYDKINNGMKYQEVIDIVGIEGEIITESGIKDTDSYGIGVMYEGAEGTGTSATFIFINDTLHTKSQFGLE